MTSAADAKVDQPVAGLVTVGLGAGLWVASLVLAATAVLLLAPAGVMQPADSSRGWLVSRYASVILAAGAVVGLAAASVGGRTRSGFATAVAATLAVAVGVPVLVLLNVRYLGGWRTTASLLGNAGALLALVVFGIASQRALVRRATTRRAPALRWTLPVYLLGALPGMLAPSPRVAAPPPADPPIPQLEPRVLVLITVDTLRADHLGAYGYDRPVSPRIDRLAAAGVRYDRVIAQAPNTHPSLASMLTGQPLTAFDHLALTGFLPRGTDTLAVRLRRRGYRTIAVVSNPYLRKEMGFDQGFDHYDDESAMVSLADAVTDAAVRATANVEGPLFLWVHYLDPHHPYLPPPPWRTRFGTESEVDRLQQRGDLSQRLIAAARGKGGWTERDWARLVELYDGEIASTDAAIGRLLDALEASGRLRDARIVLTADHGEEFRDHGGVLHSHSLYLELLRLPTIRWPRVGAEAAVRSELLAATAVGDLLTAGSAPPATEVLSEKLHEERHRSPPLVSVRTAEGTLIVPAYRPLQDWSDARRVLVAFRELCLFAPVAFQSVVLLAPHETSAAPPALQSDLESRLRRLYRSDGDHHGEDRAPTEAIREDLRGLGYLH